MNFLDLIKNFWFKHEKTCAIVLSIVILFVLTTFPFIRMILLNVFYVSILALIIYAISKIIRKNKNDKIIL